MTEKHAYDPARRDASWQMIQPGLYVDPAGHGHVFPDEVLAYMQVIYPDAGFHATDPEDLKLVMKVARDLFHNHKVDVQLIHHHRTKH